MTSTGDGVHHCTRFFLTFLSSEKNDLNQDKDKRRKTASRSIFVSWQLSTIDNYLCKYLPVLNIRFCLGETLNFYHKVKAQTVFNFVINFVAINKFLCMEMTEKELWCLNIIMLPGILLLLKLLCISMTKL